MNISVALTSYNGEKYIEEQLLSILLQLKENDEIIISDDGSDDNTIEIIKKNMKADKRIKLYQNSRLGVVKNFEFAISHCNNEIIFLSDQDDIWMDNKVNKVLKVFQNNDADVVLHNSMTFSNNDKYLTGILITNLKHGVFQNIYKSCYWGCCMAFRKDHTERILPFPDSIKAHDQWIGLIAEDNNRSFFLEENLVYHRKHDNNKSKNLSIINKIKFRFNLLKNYLNYKFRSI